MDNNCLSIMGGGWANGGGGLSYVDWDDHADIEKLPQNDLIGLSGFAITDLEKHHEIFFGVMVASYNDQNLFRMVDYVDTFYRRLLTGKQFNVFHPTSGVKIGVASMERGTAVAPVTRTETRAAQAITASAMLAIDAAYMNTL